MTFELDMDADVRSLIAHLPPTRKRVVREALRSLAKNPSAGKALQEDLVGLRSLRVGNWRVIFTVNTKERIVQVVALGPRRCIYEDVERARRRGRRDRYSAASAITSRAQASAISSSGMAGTIASTGHTGTQEPQSRQVLSSIR